MFKIAVLASTRGTDLQAIIDEIRADKMTGIELAAVISDKKNCLALERAKKQGFKTFFINPSEKTREQFDAEAAKILEKHKVDLIVLGGYMRILSAEFVKKFKNRIINVHPALIPKYSGKSFFGKSVHEAVLKNKEKETGMTIHFVSEEVDAGKIILQKKCPVFSDDTVETLKERVQELEKKYYPEVIKTLKEKLTSSI